VGRPPSLCVVDSFGGFWTTHDSAPSEARKRGSGGGSPRKSDLVFRQVQRTCWWVICGWAGPFQRNYGLTPLIEYALNAANGSATPHRRARSSQSYHRVCWFAFLTVEQSYHMPRTSIRELAINDVDQALMVTILRAKQVLMIWMIGVLMGRIRRERRLDFFRSTP
jgi:hypothetical protein